MTFVREGVKRGLPHRKPETIQELEGWDNGKQNGNYYTIKGCKAVIEGLQGLYKDNGTENGKE